jgi:hypothetical protein
MSKVNYYFNLNSRKNKKLNDAAAQLVHVVAAACVFVLKD